MNLACFLTAVRFLQQTEECPYCGCDPRDSTIHRDECVAIDTCGQIGPPWVLDELHPEDIVGEYPRREDAEPASVYNERVSQWWSAFYEHKMAAHGVGR